MSLDLIDRNHDFVADELVKKLILLFIFDKMEIPLGDGSVDEIIALNPSWMSYMECKDALFLLGESKFIHRTSAGAESRFHITESGRQALAHFFHKIPASIREEITNFSRDNRQKFKRNQEYTYDYFKNSDGTHTVVLRIKDYNVATDSLLEVRLKTPTRAGAQKAANRWRSCAALVYDWINNTMIEED